MNLPDTGTWAETGDLQGLNLIPLYTRLSKMRKPEATPPFPGAPQGDKLSEMTCARRAPMPGTAASSSTLATCKPATLPKRRSKALRR